MIRIALAWLTVLAVFCVSSIGYADEKKDDETEEEEEEDEELPEAKYLTPGQLRCLVDAKSREEVRSCLPQNGDSLVVRAGLEMGAYTDTLAVDVLSPTVTGSVTSPTGGFTVNGSYVLDVVSAASPDIVSMASPKSYGEKRHGAALGGSYKPSALTIAANASTSIEPDYVSYGGQAAVSVDLAEKLVVPRLAYELRRDTIGKGGTPFSVFSHEVETHGLDLGVTLVLSPKTLLVVGMTAGMEHGDSSKPYRHVPMFTPEAALAITEGASQSTVNRTRLPVRPLEQLPLERYRWATGARFARRIGESTLRLEERLYVDSWGVEATTTDARWLVDIGTRVRVWPHGRLHLQSAASFQKLAYVADVDARGNIALPRYRTGDRELGALVTATVGGGIRVALTPPEDKLQLGISVSGDTMLTRFFDALYVRDRAAVYGAIGFDVEVR